MIANRNQLWGQVVAQELVRCGVRDVCLSPGSRSTPLALAVHAQKGLRITTHLDERSAGFFALGIAKATHRPAVLVCTSGTAAANYLPAVVEANQSRVPLLVLTADRPPELRDVGANQSIDQQHLYGRHVRWFFDTGLPQPTAQRIRHLRAVVCRAVAKARIAPAGPVHLNFPFQEPLEPTHVPGDVPEDWHGGDLEARDGRPDAPFLQIAAGSWSPDDDALAEITTILNSTSEGVIVIGPRFPDDEFARLIKEFSEATGFPILADPVSGARYAGVDVLQSYDLWLADSKRRAGLAPRLIIRFGAAPTSKNLIAWLRQTKATQIVVTEERNLGEETTQAEHLLAGDAATITRLLLERVKRRRRGALAARLVDLDRQAGELLAAELPARPFEGAVLQRLLKQLPDDAQVFVSSSLPIRDLDRFGRRDARLKVHANRGASGIDGVTSTALGVAHATGRKVVLITGDLAFLHDLSALVTRRRLGIALDIVLLDNNGGGIFEFLPVSKQEPPFTDLFVTPHNMDLAAIGKALGMEIEELDAPKALTATFRVGDNRSPSRLVIVKTDRKRNVQHRRELEAALDGWLTKPKESRPRAR
jgi:2-succinyl-5-enolpyruvyl-6-hydroxy-3-cyclohexene-1-carboxylate synthase